MRVTSLIRSRIPPLQEAGKNGPRKTVLALVGLLDRRAQAEVPGALRPDTPAKPLFDNRRGGDQRSCGGRLLTVAVWWRRWTGKEAKRRIVETFVRSLDGEVGIEKWLATYSDAEGYSWMTMSGACSHPTLGLPFSVRPANWS
jgi:hypothetical protein